MKSKISEFIHNLLVIDYILFSTLALLFIIFLILAIVVRQKVIISVLMILIAFLLISVAPPILYNMMHDYIYKTSSNISKVQELEFLDALVVEGNFTNISKKRFKKCKVKVKLHKVNSNEFINKLLSFVSFRTKSIDIVEPIDINTSRSFRAVIEPFNYNKDYNVSIGVDCR